MGSDSEAKKAMTSKFKVSQGLNLHKASVIPVVYGLMVWYDCFTLAAMAYMVIHGMYGLLWVAKEMVFPDKRFQEPVAFGTAVAAFTITSILYYPLPWILVRGGADPPVWYVCLCVCVFTFGLWLMNVSDCQKYFQLKHAPGTLITDGFFRYLRNPNYLGELILYIALCMLTCSPWSFCLVALAVVGVWIPGMKAKDKSLSRYPEFEQWKSSTNLLVPFIF